MSFVLDLQNSAALNAADEPNNPFSTVSVGIVCAVSTVSASACASTSTLSGFLC